MLLYSLLHLAGVKAVNPKYETLGQLAVTLDDIKKFRQLDSRCPGHPEYRWTSGVETTTGPLGQGAANSVGMAIASKWMAAHFNRPGFDMFTFDVYALAGDGCMMEGVSQEAASLAGHLKLDNLCWIYDSNRITIEGIDLARLQRGRGDALRWATAGTSCTWPTPTTSRPSTRLTKRPRRPGTGRRIIIVESHIGYGAPTKQDTNAAHGEPLGDEEIRLTKKFYGWPEDAKFLVPDGVREHFAKGIGARGAKLRAEWMALFEAYKAKYPAEADALYRMQHRQLPEGWDKGIPEFPADAKGIAGRDASAKVLNAVAQNIPWLIGGSADLAPSTKTLLTFAGAGDFEAGSLGRPQLPLRRSRARDGRGPERPVALQGPPLRLGLPDLQRLRQAGHPPRRDHGDPGHLRLHPRLDRRGRGRPDPSARGAARLAARPFPASSPSAPPTPTRWPRPGGCSCSSATHPLASS